VSPRVNNKLERHEPSRSFEFPILNAEVRILSPHGGGASKALCKR
jgi:hypothetical protein